MNGLIKLIEDKFVPIAARIGSQKHLSAIRDAFASLMPLIMAGAIAVLLNNVFFVPWGLLANFIGAESGFIVWANANIAPIFSAIDAGSLSIMALGLCFSLGYKRAEYEGKDALSTALVTVGCFIVCGALVRNNELVASYVTHYLGAQGLFIGLIIGLTAPEIYMWAVDKGWVIHLPESVPPAVSKAFAGILPGLLTFLIWGLVYYMFTRLTGLNVFAWFEVNIQTALMKLSQSIWSILLISTLIPLLWFFGLHGANLLEAVMAPVYGTLGLMNIQNFAEGITKVGMGANELSPWVRGSWDAYVFLGGSGATLALVAAILLVSKAAEDREVAKYGIGCGIFQINEPVLFGLPVVLNPIYLIPFVISQPIMTLIGYYATVWGFAGPIVNTVPWTTPPVFGALLATNGSIGAALTALICLVVAFIIYLPFVMAANRAAKK
ncbi:PTS transporter subunit EIIC [uncultured Traorella sp.]|uniref:PTS sugar transporter subunit IIC n=1 Tax=uncultured Traorella sp. TaxID=1929048 RepID=UPI0025E0DA8D|nr:PTS transporter subunit EIIC [uncultured Traorella sp.]